MVHRCSHYDLQDRGRLASGEDARRMCLRVTLHETIIYQVTRLLEANAADDDHAIWTVTVSEEGPG